MKKILVLCLVLFGCSAVREAPTPVSRAEFDEHNARIAAVLVQMAEYIGKLQERGMLPKAEELGK